MVNWWFGELVVWIPIGSPYERDCCLGVPLESQTTGPQTMNLPIISWNSFAQTSLMFPKVPQSSLGRDPHLPPPLEHHPRKNPTSWNTPIIGKMVVDTQ